MRERSARSMLAVALGLIVAAISAHRFGSPSWRASPTGWRTPLDRAAAERGRIALTLEGLPEAGMVRGRLSQRRPGSGTSRLPIPTTTRPAMRPLFRHRYGLHPAPYPNDGLPMGLRRGLGPGGVKTRPADRLHGLPRRLDRRPELRRAGQHPARPEGRALRADDRRRQAPAVLHLRAQLVARDQQRRPGRRRAL